MTGGSPRLGQLLVSLGFIDEAQLERALARQRETGQRLGKVLVQSAIITEDRLVHALSRQLNIETCDPVMTPIHARVLEQVPREVAFRHRVIPLARRKDGDTETLFLATADPMDQAALEGVRQAVGTEMRLQWLLAGETEIDQALAKHHGTPPGPSAPSAGGTPATFQGVPVVQGLPFSGDLPPAPEPSVGRAPEPAPGSSPAGTFDPDNHLSYDAFQGAGSQDFQPVASFEPPEGWVPPPPGPGSNAASDAPAWPPPGPGSGASSDAPAWPPPGAGSGAASDAPAWPPPGAGSGAASDAPSVPPLPPEAEALSPAPAPTELADDALELVDPLDDDEPEELDPEALEVVEAPDVLASSDLEPVPDGLEGPPTEPPRPAPPMAPPAGESVAAFDPAGSWDGAFEPAGGAPLEADIPQPSAGSPARPIRAAGPSWGALLDGSESSVGTEPEDPSEPVDLGLDGPEPEAEARAAVPPPAPGEAAAADGSSDPVEPSPQRGGAPNDRSEQATENLDVVELDPAPLVAEGDGPVPLEPLAVAPIAAAATEGADADELEAEVHPSSDDMPALELEPEALRPLGELPPKADRADVVASVESPAELPAEAAASTLDRLEAAEDLRAGAEPLAPAPPSDSNEGAAPRLEPGAPRPPAPSAATALGRVQLVKRAVPAPSGFADDLEAPRTGDMPAVAEGLDSAGSNGLGRAPPPVSAGTLEPPPLDPDGAVGARPFSDLTTFAALDASGADGPGGEPVPPGAGLSSGPSDEAWDPGPLAVASGPSADGPVDGALSPSGGRVALDPPSGASLQDLRAQIRDFRAGAPAAPSLEAWLRFVVGALDDAGLLTDGRLAALAPHLDPSDPGH